MRFSAKFVKQVFKVINMKKLVGKNMVTPPRRLEWNAQQLKRTELAQRSEDIAGSELITLFPDHPTNRHVFYLHGGGYALEASPFHKEIQEYFVKTYGLKVSAFDYPLAPEHTAQVTLERTLAAYLRLVFLYPDDHFYLFGDSAGGGLALSLAQHLQEKRATANSETAATAGQKATQSTDQRYEQLPVSVPEKLALISPWLDLTLSDPRISAIEDKDVLLQRDLLAEAARNYAGGLPLEDPRVSPLKGPLENLGQLLVISGTDDILNPDVLRLQERINALGSQESSGTCLHLEIAPDMMHDFVVYPLKEATPYLALIGRFYVDELAAGE